MSNNKDPETKRTFRERFHKFWINWRGFFLFLVFMFVFRSVVADWNYVPTGSMWPNIVDGDRVIVDKVAYDVRWPFTMSRIARWSHPERGDIVTFPSPSENVLLIKRVIAVPGDTIELRNNRLIINGEEAVYSKISDEEAKALGFLEDNSVNYVREEILGHSRVIQWHKHRLFDRGTLAPIVMSEGTYWMMGDNRDNSGDSRVFGPIPRNSIIGRATTIAFSFDFNGNWAPRYARFVLNIN